ncbi:MAG: hypothetical protein JWL61_4972 [Gemmatimonadetes bacterium]|nr:hypothetical protein [Gemmatimonadota bacterium]
MSSHAKPYTDRHVATNHGSPIPVERCVYKCVHRHSMPNVYTPCPHGCNDEAPVARLPASEVRETCDDRGCFERGCDCGREFGKVVATPSPRSSDEPTLDELFATLRTAWSADDPHAVASAAEASIRAALSASQQREAALREAATALVENAHLVPEHGIYRVAEYRMDDLSAALSSVEGSRNVAD